jgi:hypothetical protein
VIKGDVGKRRISVTVLLGGAQIRIAALKIESGEEIANKDKNGA